MEGMSTSLVSFLLQLFICLFPFFIYLNDDFVKTVIVASVRNGTE